MPHLPGKNDRWGVFCRGHCKIVSKKAARASFCFGVNCSIRRNRISSSGELASGVSKKAFKDKPNSSQTMDRLSTEMPFSFRSTERRKLWKMPQRLARAYLKTQKCLKDKKKTQKDSIIGSKGSDRMTIHRYEVTDAEWAIIEPMLPKHHMGRPQKDLRAHFNGILWIARSGARWEDLPARYGPHQTVYSCFCRWRDDGTLERIFHKLGANAELEELNIDSTTSKVSEQASRGPRKR